MSVQHSAEMNKSILGLWSCFVKEQLKPPAVSRSLRAGLTLQVFMCTFFSCEIFQLNGKKKKHGVSLHLSPGEQDRESFRCYIEIDISTPQHCISFFWQTPWHYSHSNMLRQKKKRQNSLPFKDMHFQAGMKCRWVSLCDFCFTFNRTTSSNVTHTLPPPCQLD